MWLIETFASMVNITLQCLRLTISISVVVYVRVHVYVIVHVSLSAFQPIKHLSSLPLFFLFLLLPSFLFSFLFLLLFSCGHATL